MPKNRPPSCIPAGNQVSRLTLVLVAAVSRVMHRQLCPSLPDLTLYLCGVHAGVASSSSEGACSDSDDDCQVVFSDVPLEVVSVILQSLDPVSLAVAACVCR